MKSRWDARTHQIFGPGWKGNEEYIFNFWASLSTAQISEQLTTARLAKIYRSGCRGISFHVPANVLATNLGTYNTTYSAGNAAKVSALGDIANQWLYMAEDTSVNLIAGHVAGATYHTALVEDTSTARDSAISYMLSVLSDFGVGNHARFMAGFGCEENVTGTPASYASKKKAWQEEAIDAIRTEYPGLWYMCSTLNYSGPTDLANYTPPDRDRVVARTCHYAPFGLTHGWSFLNGTIGPDYPFTEARRLAARAEMGAATWDANTEYAAHMLAAVGYGKPEIQASMSTGIEFQNKWGIPVYWEEMGLAWLAAWGSNAPQLAWFDDSWACAKELGIENQIGIFSLGGAVPTVINYGCGATDSTNSFAATSKAVIRIVSQGDFGLEDSEVAYIATPERSDGISWTPVKLGSKLEAWYCTEDVVGADAATCASWPIRAGNWTSPLTASGASMPTISAVTATMNGVRALAFTATQYMSLSGVSLPTPFAVCIATDPTINEAAGDRYTHFIDCPSGTRFTIGTLKNSTDTTKNYFLVQSGSTFIDYNINAASTTWNSPQVITGVWSSTSNQAFTRVNGAILKTGTHSSGTLTTFRVGANLSGTDGLNGYVTDVVVVRGTLTADEMQRLEWYLAQRAGVTLSGNRYSDSVPVGGGGAGL